MSAQAGPKSVILGVAGHIDHGKTALVYALTGTDTDRLPEEKRRGITIDLGFAALSLTDTNGRLQRLSLIDVPGHHAFIRNMLAGAGGIDCVLLVVAADEGIKPQTREHFAICSLLGIERGLIALTKADLADSARIEQVRQEVSAWLAGTFLEGSPIVPVSARTGLGLDELRRALAGLAASVPERSRDFVPRLPPDRAFSMRGFGTVTTGTLQAGTVSTGSRLELQPGGRAVKVRGVQVHGAAVEQAAAPSRAALNLSGIEPDEIHRGQTFVPPGTLPAISEIDAEISLLPDAPPLRHRSRIRLHAFTGDIAATALLYEAAELRGGARALVRLRLEQPQVLVPGDRFVLRRASPPATIGGGRVLDTACPRGWKKAQIARWLDQMLDQIRNADRAQQIALRVSRRGVQGARIDELLRETGLCPEAIRSGLDALAHAGSVIAGGSPVDFAVAAGALAELENTILSQVRDAKDGTISRAELRSRSQAGEPAFELALRRLIASRKLEGGDHLSLPGRPGVNTAVQQRARALEQVYAAAGISPPLLRDAAERLHFSAGQLREAMTLLLRAQRLVRLGSDDLYIHSDAVAKLRESLSAHRGESFDVARFKNFTGLTRKHAIPLLEYLDRTHVTRNVAGTRIVL